MAPFLQAVMGHFGVPSIGWFERVRGAQRPNRCGEHRGWLLARGQWGRKKKDIKNVAADVPTADARL